MVFGSYHRIARKKTGTIQVVQEILQVADLQVGDLFDTV